MSSSQICYQGMIFVNVSSKCTALLHLEAYEIKSHEPNSTYLIRERQDISGYETQNLGLPTVSHTFSASPHCCPTSSASILSNSFTLSSMYLSSKYLLIYLQIICLTFYLYTGTFPHPSLFYPNLLPSSSTSTK